MIQDGFQLVLHGVVLLLKTYTVLVITACILWQIQIVLSSQGFPFPFLSLELGLNPALSLPSLLWKSKKVHLGEFGLAVCCTRQWL